MANGCAIATNESIFMRECFEDGREILIAGHDKEAFAQGIAEVIGNENALTAMASAAMEKFAKDHTWAVRVRDIIMAMESLP
jgi:glycosyltransferase involved in cell wall biosynthesis